MLALKALMTVEAQIRIKLESLAKPSERYRTLFYGLKRNHPHSAAVVHPLIFLIRRILYSAIVLFMIQLSMIGAYILALVCLGMIAFIMVEKQWEDSLIAWQHVINEVALYLLLLAAITSALPLPGALISSLGWFMIVIFLATLIFNIVILAYYVTVHLRLLCKRYRHILTCCKRQKKKTNTKNENELVDEDQEKEMDDIEQLKQQPENLSDIFLQQMNCSNPTKEPMLMQQAANMNIPIKLESEKHLDQTEIEEVEAILDHPAPPIAFD